MKTSNKELTPILYSAAAIKSLHFRIKPNQGCFRTHWHDRMELIRIKSGEMFCGSGTNIKKINAGEIFIIPPKMPHKGFAGDVPLDYDVLMFDVRSFYNDTGVCQTYLPAIFEGRAILKQITDDEEVLRCFDILCSADDQNSLEITSLIYRLLHLLFSRCLVELRSENKQDSVVKDIIDYFEKNYTEELSCSDLSAHFGYSSSHFSRKFKEATGLSPVNYLNIYRIERAYQLITTGSKNVSEIAVNCGFTDTNYFTRCFKAHFGKPPTYFIKEKR